MAKLGEVPLSITVDLSEVHEARIRVKRLIKDVSELNRMLAGLEARLLGLGTTLSEYGIRLETEDV